MFIEKQPQFKAVSLGYDPLSYCEASVSRLVEASCIEHAMM
jgi:hypothetical protein